jgi:hypothetical protein
MMVQSNTRSDILDSCHCATLKCPQHSTDCTRSKHAFSDGSKTEVFLSLLLHVKKVTDIITEILSEDFSLRRYLSLSLR